MVAIDRDRSQAALDRHLHAAETDRADDGVAELTSLHGPPFPCDTGKPSGSRLLRRLLGQDPVERAAGVIEDLLGPLDLLLGAGSDDLLDGDMDLCGRLSYAHQVRKRRVIPRSSEPVRGSST